MSYPKDLEECSNDQILAEAHNRISAHFLKLCSYCRKSITDPPCKMRDNHRPVICCLIGSTRFRKEFDAANEQQTLLGKIVLSCGCWDRSVSEEEKEKLDELHLRKIDASDEVFCVNVSVYCCGVCGCVWNDKDTGNRLCSCHPDCQKIMPYVGDSTRRELAYAIVKGKKILYLNPPEEND